MTYHYPGLGSTSDWPKQISRTARPIRSTSEILMVTRHQYGISALVWPVNQWWRRQMSAVFFGYLFDIQELQQANRKQNIIKHYGLFKA